MQESWNFELPTDISDQQTETILKELLEKQHNEMGIFLSYYFKKEGAVVENVSFKKLIDISDKRKGKFAVDFDLIYHNACLNIHDQNKDEMDIQFEFDKDLKQITLTGPYWPEREPDDL